MHVYYLSNDEYSNHFDHLMLDISIELTGVK